MRPRPLSARARFACTLHRPTPRAAAWPEGKRLVGEGAGLSSDDICICGCMYILGGLKFCICSVENVGPESDKRNFPKNFHSSDNCFAISIGEEAGYTCPFTPAILEIYPLFWYRLYIFYTLRGAYTPTYITYTNIYMSLYAR